MTKWLSLLYYPIVTFWNTTLYTPTTSPLQSTNKTLNFDDLRTPNGLGTLPPIYHHLTFTNYYPFNPKDPALAPLIPPSDYSCATSPPNALLGSRRSPSLPPPTFSLPSNSSSSSFTLHELSIKPLTMPPPGATLHILGHKSTPSSSSPHSSSSSSSDEYKFDVNWPSGYDLPLKVDFKDFTGRRWEGVERVESWVEFGSQGLDWEFCVDDLVVEVEGEGD
ncbi:MAG: hypothetical protein Q9227_006962 [Pyrenula ochraceoflavens]